MLAPHYFGPNSCLSSLSRCLMTAQQCQDSDKCFWHDYTQILTLIGQNQPVLGLGTGYETVAVNL